MNMTRKSYPSDVSDAEWEFLLPYLSLMREDAPQREYPLRALFNALRLALKVTAANEQERAHAAELVQKVQEVTGGTVEVAFVDQGYTGEDAANQAAAEGIKWEVVKHTEAKRGSVLLPRRWVEERSFGWAGRFRRLARDYERLSETLAGWHWLAFVGLLLAKIGLNRA
jgi:transposase